VLLLDTHVILWDAFDPARLSRRARAAIAAAARSAGIGWCDISLWEIAMLAERGRVTLPQPVAMTLGDLIARRAAAVLAITPAVAARAGGLYGLAGDPADCLIAATALETDATLVTADHRITAMPGIKVLW
jgi:PIN domain nuclease of toxin-antitoxin system